MEQLIFKEKIKEQIGNRKVIAALFYTFNFDPVFFENYVMPMFIPDKDFRDEAIFNKILWKACAKDNLVPPITVYCDYFAKNNTDAPSLGYTINCIKTPCQKGKITNFHPKQIFILVRQTNSEESLICITGSGNITPSGWCDNFECFSITELKKNKRFPNKSTRNFIQETIAKTSTGLAKSHSFSEAEDQIFEFLRYVDIDQRLFHSLDISFKTFLEREIFNVDEIFEVEIISPYFSPDLQLTDYLKSKGVKKIKALIPTLKDNAVNLDRVVFESFIDKGCFWSVWQENDLNEEVRINHAKIYRFNGRRTYTIVGSVNFTTPAWAQFNPDRNGANIEAAILYITKNNPGKLLKDDFAVKPDKYRFVIKEDLECILDNAIDRNPPDLQFTIDWRDKLLKVLAPKNIQSTCTFKSILESQILLNKDYNIQLSETDIKHLTKNSLIEIVEKTETKEAIHFYYPQQINIESKPLGFKLDTATIIKFWSFLSDDYSTESLMSRLAERSTDESGIVKEDWGTQTSLLNEMATNFNGLIKLENFLFPEKSLKKADLNAQFEKLKYYLLTENIDTIPFYLEEVRTQVEQGKKHKSFYWMVLQILINNFYSKTSKLDSPPAVSNEDWETFKKANNSYRLTLHELATKVEQNIPGLETKKKWVINQLVKNYESAK